MKKALAVLLIYTLSVAVIAQETPQAAVTENTDGSATITLTAAQWTQCQQEGGCALITRMRLEHHVEMHCRGRI